MKLIKYSSASVLITTCPMILWFWAPTAYPVFVYLLILFKMKKLFPSPDLSRQQKGQPNTDILQASVTEPLI